MVQRKLYFTIMLCTVCNNYYNIEYYLLMGGNDLHLSAVEIICALEFLMLVRHSSSSCTNFFRLNLPASLMTSHTKESLMSGEPRTPSRCWKIAS